MRRTDDPILSEIRRAHARAKRLNRSVSITPPKPEPAADPARADPQTESEARPEEPISTETPEAPPVESDEIMRMNAESDVDDGISLPITMEAEVKPLGSLDWLLRRG